MLRPDGAEASSMLDRMLIPSMGLCVCPLMVSGAATPRRSKMVGTMSTAWWYCSRMSPLAGDPAGHEMMHGSHVPPLNS